MKFDQFIGQVQHRARLGSTGEAIQAARATLGTLAERLAGGEAKDLASQLPKEIASYLQQPQKSNGRFSLDEFFHRVSEREHVPVPKAMFHSRAVLSVVTDAVSAGEMQDVRSQLPHDFQTLFEFESNGSGTEKANGQRSMQPNASGAQGSGSGTQADAGRWAELTRALNEDLAAEWGTVIRYTYQASCASGIQGAQVRELLQKEISDELRHASYLSDVIVDLGGQPTTQPKPFQKPSDLKAMIELDLATEKEDIENYTKHAQLAEQLGHTELKVQLENMAADESSHARDLRRLLRNY